MGSTLGTPWTADAAADMIWETHLKPSDQSTRLSNRDAWKYLRDSAYKRYLQLLLDNMSWTQDWKAVGLHLLPEITQMLQNDRDRNSITSWVMAHLKSPGPGSRNKPLDPESCESMLYFIARCLTLTKVGPLGNEPDPRRYGRHVQWQSGNLRNCLKVEFNVSPEQDCDHVRLCKDFDAWGIEAVGAIDIKFTDNLADHLLLIDDDSAVLVFHHASFLECHLSGAASSVLPAGLAKETLKTLALLFPQKEYSQFSRTSSHKRAWLRKLRQMYSKDYTVIVDERLTRCGDLITSDRQIKPFVFWRDRLVILKQAYDESTPRAMSQWWYDRRDGVQWYTFWVAVLVLFLTVLFGLIQCIEGALQVYKAYNPS